MAAIDLAEVPFLDGHLHPPLRAGVLDTAQLLGHWYEGPRSHVAVARDLLGFRHSQARLAAYLSCAPSPEAIADALAAIDDAARWRRAVGEGRISGLVVDTGHPHPSIAWPMSEIAGAAQVPVAALLRIEQVAGDLATEGDDFAGFIDRFDAELGAAGTRGFAGFKSVIAYRSGLAIERSSAAAAAEAYRIEAGRTSRRLTAKPLLDFLFFRMIEAARAAGLPVQLHCGYGDADIDLTLANPARLKAVLEDPAAAGVTFVLLHGAYPYQREAAWLAAVYPNIVVDICSCVPPLGPHAVLQMWRDVLAVAPVTSIQASSDATGLPEQSMLGAWLARDMLGRALGEAHADGALRAGEVEEVARSMLHGTAERLYFHQYPAAGRGRTSNGSESS